jgi:hypothetical protein
MTSIYRFELPNSLVIATHSHPPNFTHDGMFQVMSLSKLLTKLDQRLIYFIDNAKDLSSMAQVSKYCRKLAGPRMYRHLDLHKDNYVSVCRLLDTIIRHPKLT